MAKRETNQEKKSVEPEQISLEGFQFKAPLNPHLERVKQIKELLRAGKRTYIINYDSFYLFVM
jgi:hypothetical protein